MARQPSVPNLIALAAMSAHSTRGLHCNHESTHCYRSRMVQWRGRVAGPFLVLMVMMGAAACGDSTVLPQAQGTGALTAASVRIEQSGPAHAQIDASHVTFQIDNSGTLVVNLTLRSTESSPQTMTLVASLYDAGGKIIGNATGGVGSLASG